MPLNTAPKLSPWEIYQQAMGKYGFGQQSPMQAYDVRAPQTAPQSPMGTSPMLPSILAAKAAAGGTGAEALAGSSVADALAGTTMPSVGPTLANAAALPQGAGFANLGLGGMGAIPGTLGALGAAAYLSNIYEGGGKDLIKGKGKSEDYTNLMLDVNPVTAPINMGLRLFGAPSVGRMLFKPSIKDQTKARWSSLGNAQGFTAPTLNFIDQYRKYLDSAQQKTDAQYENTFAGKKAAGTLKGEDIWGGYGVIKTFGDDWLGKYTEDQRRAVSNALLAKNLVDSKKGDIVVTDAAAAKTAADEALKAMASKGKK